MNNRNKISEQTHDLVIYQTINILDNSNFDIYINPGKQKNTKVANHYPDIIITKKGERTVEFIIEVETSDSVTLAEAKDQWKVYATEIKASFYLLVPLGRKNDAARLCKQIGISARFGTYQMQNNGDIVNIIFE